MGAGLYMTAKVPPAAPLYLLAICSSLTLYASERASIFAKFAAELEQEHSFILPIRPLGLQ